MARQSEKGVADLENFGDIMGLTKEHVREPELYPEGPWTIKNVGFSTKETEDREGNDQLLINLRYVGFEPGEQVDPELIDAGGYEGRTLWVRKYISMPAIRAARDGTLSRFVNFVELHGVDTEELDLGAMCKALKGETILADIGTREYDDKQGEHHRDNTVSNFATVE